MASLATHPPTRSNPGKTAKPSKRSVNQVSKLSTIYQRHVSVPWQRTMAGAQRVMIVAYAKDQERTLRTRIGEFEEVTRNAEHDWALVDATYWFAEGLAADEYRDALACIVATPARTGRSLMPRPGPACGSRRRTR